ncbi:Glycos_transf_1 domain-containing protein [Gammaproteobacteria bacterium]
MRIAQVISSSIPILPTGERGWGAVELIMDEYTKGLRKLGHEVDLTWLDSVEPDKYDIVHIHVANLCLEAAKRGIEYIYSTHDHHSYHFGKNSGNYREQLEAMKKSMFSLAPAEYVVDYFDDTDKLFYISHGVDTSYYIPKFDYSNHKLLMCANNGVAGDYGADRKGFRYGIEAAKSLNLPITIVGADANTKFFEIHKDLLEYDKLTIIDTNPTEAEKLKIFQDHTIFLHPSNLEFGHPNLTLLEAASCCLPIVGTYKGSNKIEGMYVMNELNTEEVIKGINFVSSKYDILVVEMSIKRESYDWLNVCKNLEKKYNAVKQFQNFDSPTIRNKYIEIYNNL